jgi:hypothetical protein
MIDNAEFDQALPTRILANPEAPGPMGAPVLISRDSIRNDLPWRMADFVVIIWTPAASPNQSCEGALGMNWGLDRYEDGTGRCTVRSWIAKD